MSEIGLHTIPKITLSRIERDFSDILFTFDDIAFIGMINLPAGGAGNINHIQLFNPAGSGRIIAVSRVLLSSTVSVTFLGGVNTSAIGSDVPHLSKRFSGISSVAQVRSLTGSAISMSNIYRRVGQSLEERFIPYLLLTEGRGLVFRTVADNQELNTVFEWLQFTTTQLTG